MVNKN